MHWEATESMWLALLWYSLCCSDMEPDPQYLRGMPVYYHIYVEPKKPNS